jgi:hypothetical protein
MVRKNLHLLHMDGKLDDEQSEEIILGFKNCFREGITRPREILDLLSNCEAVERKTA